MRLILVRHGETECNKQDIWHGWDDCALTERGQSQARAVAARLVDEPIDVVYSSPSRRAFETATAIAEQHGLTPIVEEGLRERNAGDLEGMAIPDVLAAHPTIWEDRNADLWGWSPPGGETFAQVLARVHESVERLRERHEGQTVAIATHMGPVRVLICELAGIPIAETYTMPFPSTCVSIFDLQDELPRVVTLNDAAHVS